jgi:hypothetical protein
MRVEAARLVDPLRLLLPSLAPRVREGLRRLFPGALVLQVDPVGGRGI